MGSTTYRPLIGDDLDAVNRIIERAVVQWSLPERVKRLALPSYLYTAFDLEHLDGVVAWDGDTAVGVATWEAAEANDTPPNSRGLLLHGLYVDPDSQRKGIGSRLLEQAIAAARSADYDGLLVKAQAEAKEFFSNRGFERLAVSENRRDYDYRYWLPSR